MISATVALRAIPPGFIYYWLKDIIVNEFLKVVVVWTQGSADPGRGALLGSVK
jgi:hypothetical protein